jgi:hypothetical protein
VPWLLPHHHCLFTCSGNFRTFFLPFVSSSFLSSFLAFFLTSFLVLVIILCCRSLFLLQQFHFSPCHQLLTLTVPLPGFSSFPSCFALFSFVPTLLSYRLLSTLPSSSSSSSLDCCCLRWVLHHALPTNWWKMQIDRGLFIQKKGRLTYSNSTEIGGHK